VTVSEKMIRDVMFSRAKKLSPEVKITTPPKDRKFNKQTAEALKEKELEEEMKKFEKMKQELRGREYTYDSNGEVVVISPIEPEKLPAQR
jgi:hypothetical protein